MHVQPSQSVHDGPLTTGETTGEVRRTRRAQVQVQNGAEWRSCRGREGGCDGRCDGTTEGRQLDWAWGLE